jgi:hypothetical protein
MIVSQLTLFDTLIKFLIYILNILLHEKQNMPFLSNGSPCLNDDVISKKLNFEGARS